MHCRLQLHRCGTPTGDELVHNLEALHFYTVFFGIFVNLHRYNDALKAVAIGLVIQRDDIEYSIAGSEQSQCDSL
jgi:hypothetical protein